MNRFVLTSIAAAVMAIGTSGAIAQAPSTTGTGSSSSMTPSTPATRTDSMTGSAGKTMSNNYSGMRDSQAWERTHRVSKIMGTDVVNSKGEKIGDIEDIVLDAKGNVAYAIVSTGGFLGMGEKMHAVPWAAIRTSTGTDNYMLDVDRERLRTAPGFDKNTWPNMNDSKWSNDNRRFFPVSGTTRSSTMSNTVSSNTSNASNTNRTTGSSTMSSDQPLRANTGSPAQQNTPPYGVIDGGKPATGGTGAANRSSTTTQGVTTPPGAGTRAIEGDTTRSTTPGSTMPADRTSGAPSGGTAGAGTGNPVPDNPATKTVPSGR